MELNRVLIVDDDPAIRRVVSALLDLDEYGLLEAAEDDPGAVMPLPGHAATSSGSSQAPAS